MQLLDKKGAICTNSIRNGYPKVKNLKKSKRC